MASEVGSEARFELYGFQGTFVSQKMPGEGKDPLTPGRYRAAGNNIRVRARASLSLVGLLRDR